MIRRAAQEDRERYLALSREFYESPAVLHPVPESYRRRTFEAALASPELVQIYLLEDGGEAAGYAILTGGFSPEVGGACLWIEELYVRPAFQGRGLGGEFLRFARSLPCARLRLEVEPENGRAAALYRRHGFEPLEYESYVLDRPED